MSQHGIDARIDVRAFLARHIRGVDIGDSDDIFAMGLVNSMFAMQLVEFIETHFHIDIGPDDLAMEHFRTVSAIAALVERKLHGDRSEGPVDR